MHPDAKRILFTANEIEARVKELGQTITKDYVGVDKLLVVGILKGAVIFMADLVRQLELPVELDFMALSSYGSSAHSSGVVQIIKDLSHSIAGAHVLVVEDIVDTGLTLQYLRDNLITRKPASVKICTLLDKPARRKVPVQVDYNGFVVEDEFLVGYGLDYSGQYRNEKDILVLKPEIYTS